MAEKPRLLYVEDDEVLSFVTKDNLELNGMEVVLCTNGAQALKTFKGNKFDLCILDVMLPKMDGFQLATEIRKLNSQIPILFLTAKSLKEDKIHGLKLGGDDYITKPFSIEELMLKVQIFLKRKFTVDNDPNADKIFSFGSYSFNFSSLKLSNLEKSIEKNLTEREAELLRMLLQNQNQIVKRKSILERIWGEDDYFLGRSLDVFISRLRKYLKEDESLKIENIHGVGFRFITPN